MQTTPQAPTPAGRARPHRFEGYAGGREAFLLLLAATLLLASLAACSDGGREDQEPQAGVAAGTVEHGEETVRYYDGELETGADQAGPLASATSPATGSSVVEVLLRDDGIALPESLPQGKVTFVVTNTGAREHSLAITGEGGEYELETPLGPGESGEIELVLDPGLYRVYSPEEDRRLEGMVKRLRVTP
ncbi:MAG TPA: hypothetical protein VHQ65_04925 [Thermoanaerobaculia bacterium]|nr:hypothetical protein [Thermoanaerobaculia bacterium]